MFNSSQFMKMGSINYVRVHTRVTIVYHVRFNWSLRRTHVFFISWRYTHVL